MDLKSVTTKNTSTSIIRNSQFVIPNYLLTTTSSITEKESNKGEGHPAC
jgi:hypothetical protein